MASAAFRKTLFRNRDAEHSDHVTNIELFFDLVFVFAITQLSHRLLEHLTLQGALETLVLFLAVWWLWIYTSWATNWLDPERAPVRILLMAMMLGGLMLSVSLPTAFADSGAIFAATYVTLQLVRTLWIALLSRGHNPARVRNFLRIAFYFALAVPFWIAGAAAGADARLLFWAGALAIEYAGPWLFFRTPGFGRSGLDDWDISGSHMAERCSLFIIIALGEAILVTGATFAELPHDTPTLAAFAASFVGSATMWWVYFDTGAKRGGEAIEHGETGRIARNAYTYLHMPIVAGIIVTAVADEQMLTHPVGHHADLSFILVACGGPLLFLFGNLAFKWTTAERRWPPFSHMIGVALLTGVGVAGYVLHWPPLILGMASTGALIATALWEWFSLHGGWQHWTPWIGRSAAIALEDSER
ncbi:MAG: low temperature requirement protein A [Sphingomonadales bacterium]